jgi:hypothetical protein
LCQTSVCTKSLSFTSDEKDIASPVDHSIRRVEVIAWNAIPADPRPIHRRGESCSDPAWTEQSMRCTASKKVAVPVAIEPPKLFDAIIRDSHAQGIVERSRSPKTGNRV